MPFLNQPISESDTWIRQWFAIDVRSLALLRMLLALILLWDLFFHRWGNVDTFYGEGGFLSIALGRELLGEGFWSLYWLNDSRTYVVSLLAINTISAIFLFVGFRTRLSTFICLVMAWSLQVANPLVLSGGHILLRMMLFWSVFLPLGAVWSLDERTSRFERPLRYFELSPATVGIMLQLTLMYFFSGLAKWNSFWLEGVAVEYALNLEMYVKPLGRTLTQYPELLKGMTFVVLVGELVLPVLMFAPRLSQFFRGVAMAVFWSMHLGIWLTMSIGVFSAVAMAAWAVFIPAEFWDWLLGPLPEYEDVFPTQNPVAKGVGHAICCLMIPIMILLNTVNFSNQTSPFKQRLNQFASATMMIQQFKMWGRPPVLSPRFEYSATLRDGTQVNLFHRNQMPKSIYAQLRTNEWRRVHSELLADGSEQPIHRKLRMALLVWLVKNWNENVVSEDKLVSRAEFVCFQQPIRLDGVPQDESRTILATYRGGTD